MPTGGDDTFRSGGRTRISDSAENPAFFLRIFLVLYFAAGYTLRGR